jgi:acetoin utilization deacetylase AcuC-like enzyme
MGRRIASLGVPTLIVMEGGYAVEALGANVASFLDGF